MDENSNDTSAEEVAELLVSYGVRCVVLNACNSANQPADFSKESLAYNFIGKGIRNVMTMSYAVMKTTALLFMEAFYKKLLIEKCTVAQAARLGRQRLRSIKGREGRFAHLVDVGDDFLPVCYQRHQIQSSVWEAAPDDFPRVTLKMSASLSSFFGDPQAPGLAPLFGREKDLLALEAAFSEYRVVEIIGEHGVGKTCFANFCLVGAMVASDRIHQEP